jgi:formate/nitrite transporter FocA (FNT family)
MDEQEVIEEAPAAKDTLTSPEIYVEIAREGIEEMARPSISLFWSAIAAGFLISFSLLFKAVLHVETAGLAAGHAIESLGYTFGFVLVIYSRLQLFTENTITPVLPTVVTPSSQNIGNLSRVWGISLTANFIGTAIMALLFAKTTMVTPETLSAMLEISHKVAELGFWPSLIKGLPSGLLIAALVWMRPSSGESFLGLILLVTYVIAVADFTHIVVGSCEMFLLAWSGEAAMSGLALNSMLPTLIGNIVGGTMLFALIAWAQIREELRETIARLRQEAMNRKSPR